MVRRRALASLAALPLAACARGGDGAERAAGRIRLVFKYQPLWGDPAVLRALLGAFERDAPDVEIVPEPLPNAADVLHQYYLTALEGRARHFDVFVADVVWIPEFARAGWIAALDEIAPPPVLRRDFLPGAAEAVIVEGRTFAMPWYVDVGLLYRRTDLAPDPPRTLDDLARASIEARPPGAAGYVFQGRQYEGLVCNVYEAIWGHGGATMEGGRVLLDTPEAREALAFLRRLVERGAAPASVASMAEEESRRVFQEGRAVFMRNWPYARAEAERPGSPVRGRVGVSPLPTTSGDPGHGALGGWQLVMSARVEGARREAALRFIAHMGSAESNVAMALAYARNPPRRAPYEDPRLARGAPFIASLLPIVERALPRPVTPYYPLLTDGLQAEFSAGITGVRSPARALSRAQALADRITGEAR
jgi:multiple sugar transport system substrate-binding protein